MFGQRCHQPGDRLSDILLGLGHQSGQTARLDVISETSKWKHFVK